MKPLYKILIIIGIILLIALGIYLGWRNLIGPSGEEVQVPQTSEEVEVVVTTESGIELKKISEEKVFDLWVVPDTREVYYLTLDGRVFSAKEGPDLDISTQTIDALNFVEAGPKNQKVLAAFGDPRAPQWGIFDVIDRVWRPLPSEITGATWGGTNESLIATVKNANESNLVEIDLTRTPPAYKVFIRDFRLKSVAFTYLPENRLIITERPSASYAGRVWQLDLETLGFNLLVAPERGLVLRWAREKNIGFKFDTSFGFLVVDNNLRGLLPTFFNTLPQKCGASAEVVYCFAPQNIPQNVTLPDDYLQKKFFSIDDLFALNIETGSTQKILSSNSGEFPAIDAKNPQILGDKIYFINRYDNYLYELSL